jgi:hypothetical protein
VDRQPEISYNPRVRSPRAVALFLVLLAAPQLAALARQFQLGFRPLGKAPSRVPLSWDMFAVGIERCSVEWSPPVSTPLGRLSSLRDASVRLEWDLVSDSVAGYETWARWGCRHAAGPTRARLRCFTMDGRAENDAFDCR